MPLRVQCSAGHWMMAPDHRAGTTLRCPNCGIDVLVPGTAAAGAKPLGAGLGARTDVRAGVAPASRQSPQVAGHSTAAKTGAPAAAAGMATIKPRTKPPPLPAAVRVTPPASTTGADIPNETPEATLIREPPSPTLILSPPPPPPVEAHLLPVAPVAEQPLPPPEPAAPSKRREPEAAPPPAKSSNRPRLTLTGTMLSDNTDFVQERPKSPNTSGKEAESPGKVRASLMATQVEERRAKKKEAADKSAVPAKEPLPSTSASAPTVVPASRGQEAIVAPPPAAPTQSELAPTVAFVASAELLPKERAKAPAEESLHTAATMFEPQPPPQVFVHGVQATAAQRFTVWQLAGALLAALCLSIGPSLWEISNYLGSESGPGVARWAFLLLMLGVVQFGCILLLIQIPDWSSVWIVTLMSLALAAVYAAVLGLTIITRGDSTLIAALNLDYQYSTGKAPPWCVCLAATYACLAFFAGRISAKWRKVLKQVAASEQAAHAYVG